MPLIEDLKIQDLEGKALPSISEQLMKIIKLQVISVWEPTNVLRKLNELVIAVNAIHTGIGNFDQNFAQIDTNFEEFKAAVVQLDEGVDITMQQLKQVGWGRQQVPVMVQMCHPDAKLPTYANPDDAGADIYAVEDITITPGQIIPIPTGLRVAIPAGYELQVRPRSGISANTYLRVANAPGTIDSTYRDEVKVILHNTAKNSDGYYTMLVPALDLKGQIVQDEMVGRDFSYIIHKGDRIAQVVLNRVPKAVWKQVADITAVAGDRGGGFGHSGV